MVVVIQLVVQIDGMHLILMTLPENTLWILSLILTDFQRLLKMGSLLNPKICRIGMFKDPLDGLTVNQQ